MREEDRDRSRSHRAGVFAGEAWCIDRLDVLGTSLVVYCMHCMVSIQQQERAKVSRTRIGSSKLSLDLKRRTLYIRSQVKIRCRKCSGREVRDCFSPRVAAARRGMKNSSTNGEGAHST
jgi:hypothetical protein